MKNREKVPFGIYYWLQILKNRNHKKYRQHLILHRSTVMLNPINETITDRGEFCIGGTFEKPNTQ